MWKMQENQQKTKCEEEILMEKRQENIAEYVLMMLVFYSSQSQQVLKSSEYF